MATVRVYFANLRDLVNDLGRRLGADLPRSPFDQRVGDAGTLAAVAVLAKALTDKGVLTDADLLAAVDTARGEVWPQEPIQPG